MSVQRLIDGLTVRVVFSQVKGVKARHFCCNSAINGMFNLKNAATTHERAAKPLL
jgi:hypothetical protein